MAMNIEQARFNMVENQVRTWDVLDARVLETLARVRREAFVGAAHRQLAFADLCLPLGHGEVMMKPVVEGRVLQALQLLPTDRVLEVGTGSGFLCACLAALAAHVTSIDIHAEFTTTALQRLQAEGVHNATLVTADAVREWQPTDKFDVMVVTGAVAELPARWASWLVPGGRLLAVCGRSPAQQATLFTRLDAATPEVSTLFETDLPYLRHAEPSSAFVF